MPKKKDPVYFSSRSAIAQYVRVSRMTLYRWELIHPLPAQGILAHHYIYHMSDQEVIKWLRELYDKLRRRQRNEFRYSLPMELERKVCND